VTTGLRESQSEKLLLPRAEFTKRKIIWVISSEKKYFSSGEFRAD
jgi:hypothetical protein